MLKKRILLSLVVLLLFGEFYRFHSNFTAQAQVTNLITNGGFESDFTGWTAGTGVSITNDAHTGSKAARFVGSQGIDLRRVITGQQGKTYKVTLWAKLNPAYYKPDWGGFRPRIDNWPGLTEPGGDGNIGTDVYLVPSEEPIGQWFKTSFIFTVSGTYTQGDLIMGAFGGPTNYYDITIDDIQYFEVTSQQYPPTVSITANNPTLSTIPSTATFTVNADDIDGCISYYFWDFGDGGHSNLISPTHTYINNGTYTAKLVVVDDSGLSASSTTTVTINDPTKPTLTITSPQGPVYTTSNGVVSLSGTATGSSLSKVVWSTDKGTSGTFSGTTNWSGTLDVSKSPGRNRVTINAWDSSNNSNRKDIVIDYRPTAVVSILNGSAGVTANKNSVELYDKFEATFSLKNSVASNPYIPYQTGLGDGMLSAERQGVNVDGIFTSPSGRVYTQPAFLYQDYARDNVNKALYAQGAPVWKLRFSPQEKGQWFYQIKVTDDSGSSTLSDPANLNFTAVTPTNPDNHGFLHVSATDKRYFEFTDGTPFIGVGPQPSIGINPFDTDSSLAIVASKSANFARTWMSGFNIAGSSWIPWTGGLGYDGNVPESGLRTDEAYGNGIYSIALDATDPNGKKCFFYGWQGTKSWVKSNTNYQILLRVKTVGVTGSGGLTFRPNIGFASDCNAGLTDPLVVPYQSGTNDWHVVTAVWNSGRQEYPLGGFIGLQNVTGGQAYIDEISVREILSDGSLGPEVMPRSKANVQDYFSQEPSWNWDYGLDEYTKRGMYDKVVIEEKQDYSYNHISPYGYGIAMGNRMGSPGASRTYQQYFWRYLTARWGYSRAVHSWEYANEQGPGDLMMADAMSQYIHALDPNRHMGAQSPWCCVDITHSWSWGQIDYADTHMYVHAADNPSDPITGGNMANDSALFVTGNSIDDWNNNYAGGKPFVMGEAGIESGGQTAGENDTDAKGVWLHQFIWPQVNQGGMYFIYWYDSTIRRTDPLYSLYGQPNLYPLFGIYRSFMEGSASDTVNKRIPLANGKYQDIQLTLPTGLRGWGQKDTTNGGAHFWLYDSGYTWVTPTGGSAVGGKSVSFSGLPAKTYTVEFWDTWIGTVITQNVNFSGGMMSLTIPSSITQKDVAVKIIPTTGYPLSSGTTQANKADIDKNGVVNSADLKLILQNYRTTTTCGSYFCDVDADGIVTMLESVTVLKNFGL